MVEGEGEFRMQPRTLLPISSENVVEQLCHADKFKKKKRVG